MTDDTTNFSQKLHKSSSLTKKKKDLEGNKRCIILIANKHHENSLEIWTIIHGM